MMTTALKLEKVTKRYGSRTLFRDLDLEIPRGERFFLLGPSGCGKTSLLRIVAGLDRDHEGRIEIDGRIASEPGRFTPPHLRGVGLVFQDGALWPHLTVERHLTYAPGASRHMEWIDELLHLTGLADRRRDPPSALSGGEAQRLALARALSGRPSLLLLDEPLRNLDRNTAVELRRAISDILETLNITAIYVTHDQEEALSMADRILLMDREGPVQLGTPEELIRVPRTAWAAGFFGPVNRFAGRCDDEGRLATPLGSVTTGLKPRSDVLVVVRARHVEASPTDGDDAFRLKRQTFLGSGYQISCERDGTTLLAWSPEKLDCPQGRLRLTLKGPVLAYPADRSADPSSKDPVTGGPLAFESETR